jgi:hypothetical protein
MTMHKAMPLCTVLALLASWFAISSAAGLMRREGTTTDVDHAITPEGVLIQNKPEEQQKSGFAQRVFGGIREVVTGEGAPTQEVALQSHSKVDSQKGKEQMLFVHRKGDVTLEFSTKTIDLEQYACSVEGTLKDNDQEAGDLNIRFAANTLWFNVTDTVTGEMIYEERVGPPDSGVETLRVEGDNFIITQQSTAPDDSIEKESLLEGRVLVDIGEGSLLESHETHWQRVIDKRDDRDWIEAQGKVAQDKFRDSLEKLLSDPRGNALMELGITLSNADVSGSTHYCTFPLLSLVQNLRDYGKKMSPQTLQDVSDKDHAALLERAETSNISLTGSMLDTGTKQALQSGCTGCSSSCGNTCFGLCGMDCGHWTFVCGGSYRAYAGCCEHDGWCSCGRMHWHECWAFYGSCSWPGCAATRCSACSSCTGTEWHDNDNRRRRWHFRRRRTAPQAKGVCHR